MDRLWSLGCFHRFHRAHTHTQHFNILIKSAIMVCFFSYFYSFSTHQKKTSNEKAAFCPTRTIEQLKIKRFMSISLFVVILPLLNWSFSFSTLQWIGAYIRKAKPKIGSGTNDNNRNIKLKLVRSSMAHGNDFKLCCVHEQNRPPSRLLFFSLVSSQK